MICIYKKSSAYMTNDHITCTVFPHIVSAETILFWIWKSKGHNTWICGNYSREETIQGRKLYEEIRYAIKLWETTIITVSPLSVYITSIFINFGRTPGLIMFNGGTFKIFQSLEGKGKNAKLVRFRTALCFTFKP